MFGLNLVEIGSVFKALQVVTDIKTFSKIHLYYNSGDFRTNYISLPTMIPNKFDVRLLYFLCSSSIRQMKSSVHRPCGKGKAHNTYCMPFPPLFLRNYRPIANGT